MKIIHLILLFLPLLCTHCKKDDSAQTLFTMPFQEEFTIQSGLDPFQSAHFLITDIPNRVKDQLDQRGLTADGVSEISGGIAKLHTLFEGEDMSFIREISIRIYNDDPDIYRELYYRDDENLLKATSPLDLIPSLADPRGFFKNSTFNLDVVVVLRNTTIKTVDATLDFEIVVK